MGKQLAAAAAEIDEHRRGLLPPIREHVEHHLEATPAILLARPRGPAGGVPVTTELAVVVLKKCVARRRGCGDCENGDSCRGRVRRIGAGRAGVSPKRVAVMQPYFFPYAGYFRLFAAVDHFVIFDCVQFPRRGRGHRTEVPGPAGGIEWFDATAGAATARRRSIREIAFAADARARFDRRLERYPWLSAGSGPTAENVRDLLFGALGSAIDFLEAGLRLVVGELGLEAEISRSSELGLSPSLRGQDRVIAAATAVGATTYVNAPGDGRSTPPSRSSVGASSWSS